MAPRRLAIIAALALLCLSKLSLATSVVESKPAPSKYPSTSDSSSDDTDAPPAAAPRPPPPRRLAARDVRLAPATSALRHFTLLLSCHAPPIDHRFPEASLGSATPSLVASPSPPAAAAGAAAPHLRALVPVEAILAEPSAAVDGVDPAIASSTHDHITPRAYDLGTWPRRAVVAAAAGGDAASVDDADDELLLCELAHLAGGAAVRPAVLGTASLRPLHFDGDSDDGDEGAAVEHLLVFRAVPSNDDDEPPPSGGNGGGGEVVATARIACSGCRRHRHHHHDRGGHHSAATSGVIPSAALASAHAAALASVPTWDDPHHAVAAAYLSELLFQSSPSRPAASFASSNAAPAALPVPSDDNAASAITAPPQVESRPAFSGEANVHHPPFQPAASVSASPVTDGGSQPAATAQLGGGGEIDAGAGTRAEEKDSRNSPAALISLAVLGAVSLVAAAVTCAQRSFSQAATAKAAAQGQRVGGDESGGGGSGGGKVGGGGGHAKLKRRDSAFAEADDEAEAAPTGGNTPWRVAAAEAAASGGGGGKGGKNGGKAGAQQAVALPAAVSAKGCSPRDAGKRAAAAGSD